jgi:membrane glycosyltransferase
MDAIAADSDDVSWPALPDEAPLEMAAQSLRQRPEPRSRRARLPSAPRGMALRRLLVIGGAGLMTAAAAYEMYKVLTAGPLTMLAALVLVLFVALFAWIALAFTSAASGFVCLLAGGEPRLGISSAGPLPVLTIPTALLMPTYNESTARVMAGLQAVHDSLATTGQLAWFHLFILSDTTDPDVWIAEEADFLALRARTGGHGRIFYRRRRFNTERKAGNIGDWVRCFGAAYPQMLILDADSVMSGEAIVRLAAAMAAHPDVGLIQTLPIIVNGTSLFARMQQFAGRVYGPLIAHGIAWWHGAESNYWGHNAMIRTAAFASQAGLPILRGCKPFGGHILSHDFVEAALMRRGGWAIHMIPALIGSYEESPPSLADLAVRDRRWCQGNLQHGAVLSGRGLHWMSRVHLLMGIGSYITAPLWLMFLVASILISVQARFARPDYFPAGRSLFPDWPVIDPIRAMWVFAGTMGVLLAPKLLSYLALLARPEERRGCGGAGRAFLSLLAETLIAGLIAPVAMLTQSAHVAAILLGRDAGWQPQRRNDGAVPLHQVVRLYWRHTFFGLLLGGTAWLVSPYLALWMLPVVLGLALAIPLAGFTAATGPGRAFRRLGLLRIPEEVLPPATLAKANTLYRDLTAIEGLEESGLDRLVRDPALVEAHRRMLPPPRRKGRDPIDVPLLIALTLIEEAETAAAAWATMSRLERAAALGNAQALDRLLALSAGER